MSKTYTKTHIVGALAGIAFMISLITLPDGVPLADLVEEPRYVMLLVVLAASFVAFMFCGIKIYLSIPADEKAFREDDDQSASVDMRTEFRVIRWRCFFFSVLPFLLGLGMAWVGGTHPLSTFMGIEGYNWVAVGFILGGVGAALSGFMYRCPSCAEVLMTRSGRKAGLILNPDQCPHCGVRLT